MKATQLLKMQHDEVKDLLDQIEERIDEGADPSSPFDDLARSLVAHDAIERELFYPACDEVDGVEDLLGESLVEHGLAEFSLYQADLAQGEEHFEHKCSVLKEVLLHHIEEEESELFPRVEESVDASDLEQLGEQMEQRFEQVKQQDFRGLLWDNLQKVMTGRVDLEEEGDEEEDDAARARATQKGNEVSSRERVAPRSR